MTWGRFLIDAVFRGGKKHSNSGDTVANMVRHVVVLIRKHYRHDVPIVLRLDSGFFDQKLFDLFEHLGIGYICTGKLYNDSTTFAARVPVAGWSEFHGSDKVWRYFQFGDRRGSWDKSRRAFYTQPLTEDGQWLLEFARPDTVIYTNLGMGGEIDTLLEAAGCSPFKRFAPNAAYYYIMALAFFLYECFKEDVTEPVVPAISYATTLRRKVIDFAAKVVRTGGQTILKVTKATWNQLDIPRLWERSRYPPAFTWA